MQLRKAVLTQIVAVFEKYGFTELQTPALEYQEVLLGKYGPEAEKLMYLFNDPGERSVGLKYDLTVPLARYVSENRDLPLPFKRYQIQPVYRAENTQKGRYREFFQCDIDTVGVKTPASDAEILAVISDCLTALKFPDFTVQVNSRPVLFEIMEKAGVEKAQWLTAIQSIDKLDKKSTDEVQGELNEKEFSQSQIVDIFASLKTAKPDNYLTQVLNMAEKLGVKNIQFNPAVSRGLDYYDGPIFETIVHEPKIGSVTGGGRYDGLLKALGGPDLPAVGTTIGLERIIDVIEELGLWNDMKLQRTTALVTVFGDEFMDQSIEVVKLLREHHINTELYIDGNAKIEKQLKYADKKNIPYVIIVGADEIAQKVIRVKNMAERSEQIVSHEDLTHGHLPF
jgi:histidyl-tRNA synthetase